MVTSLTIEIDLLIQAPLPGLDEGAVRTLAAFVLGREGVCGVWDLCVVLTDDARLQGLHRDFLGIDTPTDVMTFPRDDQQPGADQVAGGDIIISVERAVEQAVDAGHSTQAEVRFLIVHGLLHLCGWSDATDRERQQMLEHQTALLDEMASLGARSTGS